MDNKVNIRISSNNATQFLDEVTNDIICYSENINNSLHIGIGGTSNYMTIGENVTNVHNDLTVSHNLIVKGDLLDANGESYSVREIIAGAIKTFHIADANVTKEKIATNSVYTGAIIDKSVIGQKLGDSCVSLSNVNADVLLAENIKAGVFGIQNEDQKFTFQNFTTFNKGTSVNNLDQNTYVKMLTLGSPYIIDAVGDDINGRCIRLVNKYTIDGNKKTNEYTSEINEHAMLALYMPNLIENGENRIKFGKNPYMCLHLEYIYKNSDTSNNDSAKIQLLSNTMTGSTGDSPYIQFTKTGLGINIATPEAILHCGGNAKIEGDIDISSNVNIGGNIDMTSNVNIGGNVEIKGDYTYSGSNIIMPGTTSLSFEESNIQISTSSEIEISSDGGTTLKLNVPVQIYNSKLLCQTDYADVIVNSNAENIIECVINDNNTSLESVFKSYISQTSGKIDTCHYTAYHDDNAVFKVDREGNIECESLVVSKNIQADFYSGDGGGLLNIQASSITGILSISNIAEIKSESIVGVIEGNKIEGGAIGINVDGFNLNNLNANELTGVYSANANLSVSDPYKTTDGNIRFRFDNYGETEICAPTNIKLTSSEQIILNSNTYVDNYSLITKQIICESIAANNFEGNGIGLTNIQSSNIIGSISNVQFNAGIFKTSDDITRFNFATEYTTIYSPDKLYFNSSYTYIEKAGNLVIKTKEGTDGLGIENIHEIGDDNLGNMISCFTAVNGHTEQNISDPSIEVRGTISLRHPNASNNNIRAITISHGELNTVTSYITSSGYIYGEGVYYTSDERVKTDIRPIDNALDIVSRLKPKTYDKWRLIERGNSQCNDVSKYESGLIAQDVYRDAPELRHIVEISPDADVENNIWGSCKARINYQGIIPYIIAAINEQNEIIYELRKEILSVK
jgi:hypothetical protein